MEQDNLISHKELAGMGYCLSNQEQEDFFLQIINDEYALRVGEEISRRLPRDKLVEVFILPEGSMQDYLKRNVPGIEVAAIEIREELLNELREKRRAILFGVVGNE